MPSDEDLPVRAGAMRRLAAAWVDAFVVYGVAAVLLAVTATARIRLAFEPL